MKNSLLALMIVPIALLLLNGCSTAGGAGRSSDTDNQPKQFSLYSTVPVMLVSLEISKDQVKIVSIKEVQGAPSSSIIKDRPLVITAIDSEGKDISAISLINPLEIRTTGSKKPQLAELERSIVTISFTEPEDIDSLKIEINNGPGKGLKKYINVRDTTKKRKD